MRKKLKSKNKGKKFLKSIILYFILIFTFVIFQNKSIKYEMTVLYVDGNAKICQLFYDIGEGFSENNSQLSIVENDKAVFSLEKNTFEKILLFRLDPSNLGDDKIKISRITFSLGNHHVWTLKAPAMKEYISDTKNINDISFQEDYIEITALNEDPEYNGIII